MWDATDILRAGTHYESQRHIAAADRARQARRLRGDRDRARRSTR